MSEAVIVDAIRTPVWQGDQGDTAGQTRGRSRRDSAARARRAQPGNRLQRDHRRDDGLWLSRSRAGLQHSPQRSVACRSRPSHSRGHRQPLLCVLAADDQDGVPRDQSRRRGPVHRRRCGMHVPGRGHDPPGAEPAAGGRKRHRLQRLHPDGHDGRERGRAMQGQPRGPGRVGGDLPGACGRGTRRAATSTARSWGWTYPKPTMPAAT